MTPAPDARDGGESAIRVVSGRLELRGRSLPLLSGEVQYWRTDPAAWPRVLDAVVELGLPIVSTYLSWRRHEPQEGRLRWGADDPSLDLRRFLGLCAERDLLVQLKPGPWICAEEIGGGYPDWLMAREADLALGAGGRPCLGYNTPFQHPVPSMHASGYLATASRWLNDVWAEVGDLTYPDGPVIAVQLDNEPSMAFQDALYFADYHPAAIAKFRRWLETRYSGEVRAWQDAWGAAAAETFAQAEPPRPDTSDGRGLDLVGPVAAPTPPSAAADRDWLSFIEDSLVEHLAALREVHRAAGKGHLLATVNLIPNLVHEGPLRHRSVRAGLGGGDGIAIGVDHYYDPPMDWPLVSCLARTAAAARAAGEPLVWAPEMMAGIWRSPGEVVTYPDPTPDEQAAWWGAAMALGYQGFNFYMLVDRENWQFAPISTAGEPGPFAEPLRRLTALLRACPQVLDARPVTSVYVATHRADLLDAHTTEGSMRQPVVPWADPIRRVAYDAWDALVTGLVRSSVGYELWDTDAPAPAKGSTVLVAEPSSAPAEALAALEAAGCTVVRVQNGTQLPAAVRALSCVRVVEHDPESKVLVAVHEAGDGSRLLHLAQWGRVQPVPGRFETDDPSGDWCDAVSGEPLPRHAEGGWVVPSFVGHRVFRWAARVGAAAES